MGIAHYLTGPSNYTVDSQLILGCHPDLTGLWVASGCNGSGISFSGGVGRLLAEWVCGEPGFSSTARSRPVWRRRATANLTHFPPNFWQPVLPPVPKNPLAKFFLGDIMQYLDAVIFDWAGTLVDFGSLAPTQIFVDAFATFGYCDIGSG